MSPPPVKLRDSLTFPLLPQPVTALCAFGALHNEFQERSSLPRSFDLPCCCANRAWIFPEGALWPLRATGGYALSCPMCPGLMFETITHLLNGSKMQENPG